MSLRRNKIYKIIIWLILIAGLTIIFIAYRDNQKKEKESLYSLKKEETIRQVSSSINSTPLPTQAPTSSNVQSTSTEISFAWKGKISLITDDGVRITGVYQKPKGAKIAVLLLHMMPATKESWSKFSSFLNKYGYATLAIDLRGHGESRYQVVNGEKKELDYRFFSDPEHQASILDVEAASKFLKEDGFDLSAQYIIGASIGANLALEFSANHPGIKKIVVLSPGLDYQGIKTLNFLGQLQKDQKILAVASQNDYYSFQSVRKLEAEAKTLSLDFETVYYKSAGHGTNMFNKESPDLKRVIFNFLKD